ncbi:MAG: recombinase family protein [Clostridia bacterium]|nr:recombinase family protein [Clostridia bacterium]
MDKVAIYLRKSREDEELKGETLARHEKMLTEYCARQKLHIAKIYKEVVSGESIANRPQMQLLLDDVAAGLYDGVVCVEIERLSRGNQIDQVEILDVFKGSKTKIYTLQKIYDLSKEEIDEEYFEFALFMSRREYKTITRRLQRGRLQATKEGYYIGNNLPYGFDKVKIDKGYVLTPNPIEADVVRYIFNEYVAGVGTSSIAKALNDKGIRTKQGSFWVNTRIIDTIKNKVYIGMIHSTKLDIWVEGKHEAIIDPATFEQAQVIYNTKAPKVRKNDKIKNPLAGLVKCGCCGLLMQRNSNRYKYEYLLCNRNPNCTNRKAIRLDYLEKEILTELKKALKGFNYFLDNYHEESKAKRNSLDNELTLLNKELKLKETQIEKACDLLEQGVYNIDLFKKRTEKLEIEIENIKQRIKEIKETPLDDDIKALNAIPILEKVLEKYPNLDIEQKNKLLKTIIKSIEITTIDGVTDIKVELLV